MEAGLTGAIDGLIEISESSQGEEMLGDVVLDPCGCPKGVIGIAGKVAFLDGLGVLNDLPAITRQISPMDDEDACGATTRGFFVLVGPAAVVGEGLAVEEFYVVGRRLVDDDEGDLAVEVDVLAIGAGVVIPVVFGGVDAVTDEDNRRVYVGCGLAGFVFRNDLAAVDEIDGLPIFRDEGKLCFVFDGMDGEERDLLEEGVVVAGRLEAVKGELGGNVFGGELVATSAGAAAFQQIERQEANVSADSLRVDGCGGGAGNRRQAGNGVN